MSDRKCSCHPSQDPQAWKHSGGAGGRGWAEALQGFKLTGLHWSDLHTHETCPASLRGRKGSFTCSCFKNSEKRIMKLLHICAPLSSDSSIDCLQWLVILLCSSLFKMLFTALSAPGRRAVNLANMATQTFEEPRKGPMFPVWNLQNHPPGTWL
jgi:hypothetical protein